MRAWIIDAGLTDFTSEELSSFTPVGNETIKSFLATRNSMATILVAPKGYGKTLLLKKKVADLRKFYSGERVHIHPSNASGTVEVLRVDGMAQKMADWDWAKRLTTHQQWSDIWTYAISFLVCINESKMPNASIASKEAAQAIDSLFIGHAEPYLANEVDSQNKGKIASHKKIKNSKNSNQFLTVRNFFSAMAQNWENNSIEYSKLYTLKVQGVLDNLETLHFLFLDSPDESLNWDSSAPEQSTEALDDVGLWGSFPDQWVNFNIGLVDAIRRLRQMYGQIRVFTAIRTEALNSVEAAVGMQYEEMCARLSYTKQELREIFERNIELMSNDDEDRNLLVTYPFKNSLIKDFIGIDRALHSPTNTFEDLFDAIVRHTRWTPRDLMMMGKAFTKLPTSLRSKCTETDLDPIRSVIDDTSMIFLNNHKSASIPIYPETLNNLIAKFRTNIIHVSALRTLAPIEARNTSIGCPFDYLYSQGLFGWIGNKAAGNSNRILFLEGQKIASRGQILPMARWYAYHPIFFGYLRQIHGDGKSNSNGYCSSEKAIVGNENEIALPFILTVTINNDSGIITICGAMIFELKIINDAAAVIFLVLIKNAVLNQTLEFEKEEVLKTYDDLALKFKWIRGKSLRNDEKLNIFGGFDSHRNALISALQGVSDETRKINKWLASAFGNESENIIQKNIHLASDKLISNSNRIKIQNAIRIRWNKPNLHMDGILLSEITYIES